MNTVSVLALGLVETWLGILMHEGGHVAAGGPAANVVAAPAATGTAA